MLEKHDYDKLKKEQAEKEYERKLDACYNKLDEEFGELCDKIITESMRLANIYDIDDSDIIAAFIKDKFFVEKDKK